MSPPRPKRTKTIAKYIEDEDEIIIKSTSYWTNTDVKYFNINVVDAANFGTRDNILKELELPIWKTGKWLETVDIDKLNIENAKIRTLINKTIPIQKTLGQINEYIVDGYMNTLLALMQMDDDPCLFFPKHTFDVDIGNEHIRSVVDFGILSRTMKTAVIIIEDKTNENANYSNNWKEAQILGEIFVGLLSDINIETIYAVRVVTNLFTFYRTTISEDYRLAALQNRLTENQHLTVKRFPTVGNTAQLNALDFFKYEDRVQILKHLSYLHEKLTR